MNYINESGLQKEVKQNPVLSALCKIFLKRKRTRGELRIHSLTQKMRNEGFHFNKSEYRGALKMLSDFGFGKLEFNRNNVIIGLSHIPISLKKIGLMGLVEEDNQLSSIIKQNKESLKSNSLSNINITFSVNDKKVTIDIPDTMTNGEIADIVSRLHPDKSF